MEDLKEIIAKRLVYFRKEARLTQLELAEKLKYSDKNISKWERGESVPDVVVLKQLADLYKIKVDDFFSENVVKKIEVENVQKHKTMNQQQTLITLLSISLVWLVAIVSFVVFVNFEFSKDYAWLSFIFALPISCVVTLIFTSLWCTNRLNVIVISFLIWTTGLSIFLSVNVNAIWTIFLVCVPVQILDILWFSFKKINKKNNLEKKNVLNKQEKLKIKQERKLLNQQKKIEKVKNKKEIKAQKEQFKKEKRALKNLRKQIKKDKPM